MEEITAEQVTLRCVNALELLPETIPSITQLADGKFFARLINILKNPDVQNCDLVSNIPTLETILKEHFAGPDLVNFEDVAGGNHMELTKLTLLLMYIMIFMDAKLRSKLISSPVMDQSTQIKFKYLIESIQRRGSGMSAKFLNILCTERLDGKVSARCQTPVSNSAPWGSPNIYSSSPKAAPTSPLRDLVQSPPFRMQKLLNGKTKEVKQLQQQIHSLENEKQESEVNIVLLHKKIAKLTSDLEKCQSEVRDEKQYRDELEAKLMAGEDLVQQQMHRLAKESELLRTENASLQKTVNKLLESNDELSTKKESLHRRYTLVTAERDRLEEEISTLSRAGLENQSIIESQSTLLIELRGQLEELQQCLLENNRPANRTIEESFEGGSPMNFYDAASPANASGSGGNVSGENMAEAIVDKILGETQEQLTKLQSQYAALKEKLGETTYSRDQLLAQVSCKM
ncbi:nuclear mitotic apparatus protein 1-like [Penaeus japonicus]|uniref:nuclear mitotic apparatus protein 1-like n=1 Tax=Penaeus japonicus TaxID=27405 RepID=UPI001C717A72|nr:nuclear mitotic apparatus protein 1-like [Penaeus japonicus]